MRLQSLDLIRYGRFTDEALGFPRADCDFHLVVGPNEAGKSTLRRAVAELLYGMPLQSDMDFRHAIAELRLGAVIESPGVGTLAFHRARGRKSLRRPDDSVLPDTALVEHLGSSTKAGFERMFCLDLPGLIAGGQSILDAKDDAGQMLFQSAAGLAPLGALRDALAAEADTLYAPRRSEKRAFYSALDQVEAARQALRASTVNTRVWTAAVAEVERLEAASADAAARWRQLSDERVKLERLRRIAPRVTQWRELQAQLDALAQAPLFPPDAARRLADAEVALAKQHATRALQQQAARALRAQRDALTVDDAVLAQAAAVQALAEQGQACAHHLRDMARREDEVQHHLRAAAALAAQLGWPADEAALRARLPTPLALKAVAASMQQQGALLQARDSAELALARAVATLTRLEAPAREDSAAAPPATPATRSADAAPVDLAADPPNDAPTGPCEGASDPAADLQAALQQAQRILAAAPHRDALRRALAQAEAQLQAALAALGPWRREPAALAGLQLPSEERLGLLKAEQAERAAAHAAARQQQEQAREQARRTALALTQFTAAQQVLTPDDVQSARAARDQLWAHIKARPQTLADAAAPLDRAIAHADDLSDRLREQASQSAQLIRLRQDAERDQAAADAASRHAQATAQRLAEAEARWAAQATAMGLDGMPLLDLSAWSAARRSALDAAATRAERQRELADQQRAETQATEALAHALRACGVEVAQTLALPALCSRAEQWLNERRNARAQAEARADQRAQARAELEHQRLQLQRSQAQLHDWERRWQAALQAAGLPRAGMTPALAPAALEAVDGVRDLLAQVDALREQRIQTMRRDLADFDAATARLRRVLEPEGDDRAARDEPGRGVTRGVAGAPPEAGAAMADSHAWARAALERLQRAREAHKERTRLQAELQDNDRALRASEAALASLHATLAPLYALAQTEDAARLGERIAASDLRRRLESEARQQRQAIVEAGDGPTLEALLAEHDAAGSTLGAGGSLPARLEQLAAQLEAVAQEQRQLAVALSQAQAERDRIHGGDAAARAEGQRLEALAQLGDVAERYLQVATGHRLLRWAVERYRERRQGPLLQRASNLFAQLTLGGFARLAPDFEHDPPRLDAVRASGERVGVDGLSEGTRDQLFLALRLAALELHIAADRPLPFIADDLFVNFHDQRSRAGLHVLGALARRTQVIFLTHHEHLVEVARECIGPQIHVLRLGAG
ncbi:MAG: AAA family ATPase [Burkholderiaceae bacterium]|nr:AAA family ATPase [Burkholderiaceae bacterium]